MSSHSFTDRHNLEEELQKNHLWMGFIVHVLPRTKEDWRRLAGLSKLLVIVGILYAVQVDSDLPKTHNAPVQHHQILSPDGTEQDK